MFSSHVFLVIAMAVLVSGCGTPLKSPLTLEAGDDHTPDLTALGDAELSDYTTGLPKLLWADVYQLPSLDSARRSRGDGADFPVSYGLYADPITSSKADEPEAAGLAAVWRRVPMKRVNHPAQFAPAYGLEFIGRQSDCICSISLTSDGRYAYIYPCNAPAKPFFASTDVKSAATGELLRYIQRLLSNRRRSIAGHPHKVAQASRNQSLERTDGSHTEPPSRR